MILQLYNDAIDANHNVTKEQDHSGWVQTTVLIFGPIRNSQHINLIIVEVLFERLLKVIIIYAQGAVQTSMIVTRGYILVVQVIIVSICQEL